MTANRNLRHYDAAVDAADRHVTVRAGLRGGFIYVTAEILPVGAVGDSAETCASAWSLVGTLLSWYALVAARDNGSAGALDRTGRAAGLVKSAWSADRLATRRRWRPTSRCWPPGGALRGHPWPAVGGHRARSPPGWCRPVTPGAPF